MVEARSRDPGGELDLELVKAAVGHEVLGLEHQEVGHRGGFEDLVSRLTDIVEVLHQETAGLDRQMGQGLGVETGPATRGFQLAAGLPGNELGRRGVFEVLGRAPGSGQRVGHALDVDRLDRPSRLLHRPGGRPDPRQDPALGLGIGQDLGGEALGKIDQVLRVRHVPQQGGQIGHRFTEILDHGDEVFELGDPIVDDPRADQAGGGRPSEAIARRTTGGVAGDRVVLRQAHDLAARCAVRERPRRRRT